MTTARSQLICPDITRYYHCVSRCVRRSYLCGEDQFSGKSYEHRRNWVEQRILTLATIYCIDICSYSVMSNHYHLVVFIDKDAALSLSQKDIIERWCTEHKTPRLIDKFLSDQPLSKTQLKTCHKLIEIWRERLFSLSWFMKELNYDIAVQANREDGCTGRFWEGRFKSQALLDDHALVNAMLYVDLNPIRAELAKLPEESDYTSIQSRLTVLKTGNTSSYPLLDFIGYDTSPKDKGIPFRLMDYIELIEWTGRQIHQNKKGHIDEHQPTILTRLSLTSTECLKLCTGLEQKSRLWIGKPEPLLAAKKYLKRKRMLGIQIS